MRASVLYSPAVVAGGVAQRQRGGGLPAGVVELAVEDRAARPWRGSTGRPWAAARSAGQPQLRGRGAAPRAVRLAGDEVGVPLLRRRRARPGCGGRTGGKTASPGRPANTGPNAASRGSMFQAALVPLASPPPLPAMLPSLERLSCPTASGSFGSLFLALSPSALSSAGGIGRRAALGLAEAAPGRPRRTDPARAPPGLAAAIVPDQPAQGVRRARVGRIAVAP